MEKDNLQQTAEPTTLARVVHTPSWFMTTTVKIKSAQNQERPFCHSNFGTSGRAKHDGFRFQERHSCSVGRTRYRTNWAELRDEEDAKIKCTFSEMSRRHDSNAALFTTVTVIIEL